jgi:hypothetical protein
VGWFVNLVGEFTCVRCRRLSAACIQSKLLRHEADNSCREYRVGDSEVLVGLEDYCPLDPWDGQSLLVVVVGEWDCEHCGLSWQWAKAEFRVRLEAGESVATLRHLICFQPWQPADLDGVNYAEACLAELSGMWAPPPQYNWHEGLELWQACPLSERRERVAAGYRAWCHQVAGVDPDAE